MVDLITVESYPSRLEAEIAKGLLEVNGIKSLIVADDAGGMRPFPISYTVGVELKVLEEEFEEAKKILNKKSKIFTTKDPSWPLVTRLLTSKS